MARRKYPKNEANFHGLYRDRKRSAVNKGLTWELSKEDFKILTQQDCFYCGAEPSQIKKYNLKGDNDPYIYNGIDRLDSDEGYVVGNCVPCCGKCNRAKYTMSANEFLDHVKKIHLHQERKA